jgi:hypothetical protein
MAAMTEMKIGKDSPLVFVHAFSFGNQGGMKLTFPLSTEFSQFILHEIELLRWQ